MKLAWCMVPDFSLRLSAQGQDCCSCPELTTYIPCPGYHEPLGTLVPSGPALLMPDPLAIANTAISLCLA
jgi:hypothetical protein